MTPAHRVDRGPAATPQFLRLRDPPTPEEEAGRGCSRHAAAGRTRPFWDHANRPSAEVLSGGDFGGHPRLWPGSCRGSAENVQGNLFGDGLFVEA